MADDTTSVLVPDVVDALGGALARSMTAEGALLARVLLTQEQRLRALEPCPASYPGAPHEWSPLGACALCGVAQPPSVAAAQERTDRRAALHREAAPSDGGQPIPTGCARHPIASLVCADCENVVRARVEAKGKAP